MSIMPPTRVDSYVSGASAAFGTAREEIARISKCRNNYFLVLRLGYRDDHATLRSHYHTLSRLLHPDRCHEPGAEEAFKTVSVAHGTLNDPIKKAVYMQYVAQVNVDAPDSQTQAEWMATGGPQIRLPGWLLWLLGLRGVGWVFALIIIALMLPLALCALVLALAMQLLCFPCILVSRHQARQVAKGAEGGGAPEAQADARV